MELVPLCIIKESDGDNMKMSENGLNLIKKYEGCRLKAYKPVAAEKYWTIGWGHYGADVTEGMVISQEQADQMLLEDMIKYENAVNTTCDYLDLNQNQFDALVSFTYNCGSGSLIQLTQNKTRDIQQIANHIELYNKGADGKTLAGLVRRRQEEKQLFITPIAKENTLEENMAIVQERCGYDDNTMFWLSRYIYRDALFEKWAQSYKK